MIGRQEFRDGMARFAAAVTLVTTDGIGGRAGLTASSVTSVTDTPPTVLVCLNRSGHTGPILRDNGAFAVNLLAADQKALALLFSQPWVSMAERFASGEWEALTTGAPILRHALVAFDCKLVREVEIGTHSVLFGEVVAVRSGEPRPSLIYASRGYHELDCLEPVLDRAAE
jgi:flavin reductase